jgi:hypothetical protein
MADPVAPAAPAPEAAAPTAPSASTPAESGPALVDWTKEIPKEYATDALWQRFQGKPLGEVLKSHAEANKYIGGAIKLPGKEAKPEELAALRTKLAGAGVIEAPPPTPEAYQVTAPPLPDGVEWNADAQKDFLQAAHRAGLTQPQVQAVLGWYGAFIGGVTRESESQAQAAVQELQAEWGPLFDKKVTLASRAIKQIGGDPALDLLNSRGLGNHPVIVRMFATIGEELAEDGFIPGHVEGVQSAEDAQAQIRKIMADPTDLYHAPHAGKLGHAERVQEVGTLFKLAYPV